MSALQAARIMNLRAALAAIAGGTPALELHPELAQHHLELAQTSAEIAIQEDDAAEEQIARS